MTVKTAHTKRAAELEIQHLKQKLRRVLAANARLRAEKRALLTRTQRTRSASPCGPCGSDSGYGSEENFLPLLCPFTHEWVGELVVPGDDDPRESTSEWGSESDVDDRTELISEEGEWEGDEEAPPEEEVDAPGGGFTWLDMGEAGAQPDWVDPAELPPPESPDPWASTDTNDLEESEESGDLTALQHLETSTRLRDRAFYSTPPGHAALPLEAQQALMESARSHARHALYNALGKYWPTGQTQYYLHGPLAVRFGREELNESVGYEASHRVAKGLNNGTDPMRIEEPLNATIGLRNALCHQEFLFSYRVDELMSFAQALCCALGDEERAMGVREARDRLQGLVEESFGEMERCEPLVRVSEPHHQEVFRLVEDQLREEWMEAGLVKKHGVEVVRLAREWAKRFSKPGREREGFEAEM